MSDLKRKSDLPTITTFGMELPIIADLGDGWFLVAHPNGPAIATKTLLTVLCTESAETVISPQDWDEGLDEGESQIPVPESVRASAVEAFESLAWPLVRGQFYSYENPNSGGKKACLNKKNDDWSRCGMT